MTDWGTAAPRRKLLFVADRVTWDEGERKRSIEARAERVRKAAEGWDTNGEWHRAMGVEPRVRKAK